MQISQPDIYLFNPTCEYAIANGNVSWQPNKLLSQMETDLGSLPLFFAQPNDIVLVNRIPSTTFLKTFEQFGITPPKFRQTTKALSDREFVQQTFGKLKPWGWSPAAHKLLSPLKDSCSKEFKNSPVFHWTPDSRNFYSKKFAMEMLQTFLQKFREDDFIDADEIAQVCIEKADFESQLERHKKLMVKAPWSSSGRGLQPITKMPIHEKVWEKLMGMVRDQGFALSEAYQEKQLDIAWQFYIEKGKISFVGISNFSADQKGQYMGNSLNGLPDKLDETVKAFAHKSTRKIVPMLIELLEESELAKAFEGNFGVDALIFKSRSGALKINPCLEINLRQNMGLLSLYLEKLIHPNHKGIYRTWFSPKKSFAAFKAEMEKEHPLVIEDKKITSGFFPLTEAHPESRFGAYILV